MSSDNDATVAVGISIGFQYARVAVIDNNSNVKLVSNRLGQLETRACVVEQDMDSHVIMGDAAVKYLEKQKMEVDKCSVQAYLDENEHQKLCSDFMGHLASLASDAMAVPPERLRVALSVPSSASPDYVERLVECIQLGVRDLAKKNGKKKKTKNVVGVLTDAAAVCVAHDVTNSSQNSKIVVVDWGASSFRVTSLTCNSGILTQVGFQQHDELRSLALVEVFAKHVASMFERKTKCSNVWGSYKARTKLMAACSGAIKSLTSAATVHVTIDGLYEGMDCHVGVSRPRVEMLFAPLLAKAQAVMEQVNANFVPQTVLRAGSACLLACVQQALDRAFPNTRNGVDTIAPHEAVALGCVLHAEQVTDFEEFKHRNVLEPTTAIVTSPVGVGLKMGNSAVTLISKGAPLPAHIAYNFVCNTKEMELWQLCPANKKIATLRELPDLGKTVELLLELNNQGSLSLAIQGGETIKIV